MLMSFAVLSHLRKFLLCYLSYTYVLLAGGIDSRLLVPVYCVGVYDR